MNNLKYWKRECDFKKSIDDYIKYAHDQNELVNISGFVVYLCDHKKMISRQTLYNYRDIYPSTYAYFEERLENEALNNTTLKDAMKIFYLKNKCGYVDKQELKQDISMPTIEDYLKDNKFEL